MTTPLLLMSAWAGLISTYSLQEVLLRFLLSLYFSPDYCVCKWSQFWLRTRTQVTKYRAHSPRRGWSCIALSHVQVTSKPKRWHLGAKHAQHLILAPGTSESSESPYPRLLYHSAYHLAPTASPLNLVCEPSQTLHYLFWNRNWYSNTAVHRVSKPCRPSTVRSQCLQSVVC